MRGDNSNESYNRQREITTRLGYQQRGVAICRRQRIKQQVNNVGVGVTIFTPRRCRFHSFSTPLPFSPPPLIIFALLMPDILPFSRITTSRLFTPRADATLLPFH